MLEKIIFPVLICLFIGCRKDPSIEIYKQEEDSIKNIVYIERNDIYYLESFKGNPVKITNNSEEEKVAVRVSYNGEKIAYLNNSGVLKIIYRSDSTVFVVENAGVKDFNWSADDQTLYYLKGQELFFFGPEMNIPDFSAPDGVLLGGSANFHSVSISPQNDLAYTLTWTKWVSTFEVYYHFYFVRKSFDGQFNLVVEAQSPRFKSVRYTGRKNDLVLTTEWNYFENNTYYSDFSDEVPFAWDPNIEHPIYNSNGDYLLGFKKNPSDPAKYKLVIQNSAGSIIRSKDDLSLSLNISDLDWKQLSE